MKWQKEQRYFRNLKPVCFEVGFILRNILGKHSFSGTGMDGTLLAWLSVSGCNPHRGATTILVVFLYFVGSFSFVNSRMIQQPFTNTSKQNKWLFDSWQQHCSLPFLFLVESILTISIEHRWMFHFDCGQYLDLSKRKTNLTTRNQAYREHQTLIPWRY